MPRDFIVLPDREELLRRLESTDFAKRREFAQKVFPVILEEAGKEVVAPVMLLVIVKAIYNLPYEFPAKDVLIRSVGPGLIDAISGGDAEFAKYTKSLILISFP